MRLILFGFLASFLFFLFSLFFKQNKEKHIWLIFLFRLLWILPFLSFLFPRYMIKELSFFKQKETINFFLDDSESMDSWKKNQDKILETFQSEAKSRGYDIRLSTLKNQNDPSYSYLKFELSKWFDLFSKEQSPWVILTDGGDSYPHNDPSFFKKSQGLVIGFARTPDKNLWIRDLRLASLGFEASHPSAVFTIGRDGSLDQSLTVQVQAKTKDQILLTENFTFAKGQNQITQEWLLPTLSRGSHLIELHILETPGEKAYWDNKVRGNLDILTNTVQILHLLGQPSFDGRFVRRYLKTEPKYDLVSFFILRDPWDSDPIAPEELSLIPFPVGKIFGEELPHFRVLILQNFQLSLFLEPQYQKNLIDFVKNGGSLLFIGGPRALSPQDLSPDSPLSAILPFEASVVEHLNFDPQLSGQISISKPSQKQKDLATVFYDLEKIMPTSQLLQGFHPMMKPRWKTDETTPLLDIFSTQNGETIPLVTASYPGKGRAIWIWTDQLWKLALSEPLPRSLYHDMLQSMMVWLLRQDIQSVLDISSFEWKEEQQRIYWQVLFQGPASSYLDPSWSVTLCGIQHDILEKNSSVSFLAKGTFQTEIIPQNRQCTLNLKAEHPAFGSLSIEKELFFESAVPDKDLPFGSSYFLDQLVAQTGADFVDFEKEGHHLDWIYSYFDRLPKMEAVKEKTTYEKEKDYFWIFHSYWFWICLLSCLCEIWVRKFKNPY